MFISQKNLYEMSMEDKEKIAEKPLSLISSPDSLPTMSTVKRSYPF